ncbi:MAG: hypothetical protein L0387_15685 [Acidobacteria bacterium]|nr:hypothetical protein [Acidobacteriota bacterium]MCI0623073.1 hypothetical protein [Acidobacteriota bacterium]MCI0721839.1 hypothetical protein [Acidobacteriota bacterium]
MRTQSTDTHPAAEAVQIDLLRKAGTAKRLSIAFSLSEEVSLLAYDGIRRAHPKATKDEALHIFASVHYGAELAEKLRECLVRRRR